MEGEISDRTYDRIKSLVEDYTSGELNKDIFIHNFDGKLPSENPNDYMTAYYTLQVKNRRIFDVGYINSIVLELGPKMYYYLLPPVIK